MAGWTTLALIAATGRRALALTAAEEMGLDQYQTLMDINLKGVFLSCQA